MSTKLFLIPNQIHDSQDVAVPVFVCGMEHVRIFFVEEIKSARRLLKKINPRIQIDQCTFYDLNEHIALKETVDNLQKCGDQDIAMISEAGCPCVADPGADLVMLAHQQGRIIIPFVGPSSILLALMASGLSGQSFAFNGYLPKDRADRIQKLKDLEKRSATERQTQIFMEAPYRNQNLLEDVLQQCHPGTLLCLAVDLLNPTQFIKTQSIRDWKSSPVEINKKPALFLLQAVFS